MKMEDLNANDIDAAIKIILGHSKKHGNRDQRIMKESKYKKELAEFDVEKAYKTEEVMDMLKKQPKEIS